MQLDLLKQHLKIRFRYVLSTVSALTHLTLPSTLLVKEAEIRGYCITVIQCSLIISCSRGAPLWAGHTLCLLVCSFMHGGALHNAQCWGELKYAQFRCCTVPRDLHEGNLVCIVHQAASTKWSLMCCTLTGSSSGTFKTVLVKSVYEWTPCSAILLFL